MDVCIQCQTDGAARALCLETQRVQQPVKGGHVGLTPRINDGGVKIRSLQGVWGLWERRKCERQKRLETEISDLQEELEEHIQTKTFRRKPPQINQSDALVCASSV